MPRLVGGADAAGTEAFDNPVAMELEEAGADDVELAGAADFGDDAPPL
jgi:hypothetical protein